jgi:hypothetical protein
MAKRERIKKTKADQWINLELVWWMTRMSVYHEQSIEETSRLTDGKESPGDGGGSGSVSLSASKSIGGSGRL